MLQLFQLVISGLTCSKIDVIEVWILYRRPSYETELREVDGILHNRDPHSFL